MSESAGIIARTRSRRGVAALALALVLVLAGCTGSDDRSGTADNGEQARIVQPTASGDTADQVWWDVDPGPDLYRVDPTTGGTEQILSTAGELHEPEVSPDGSQLVYQSFAPNRTLQIFLLEDGSARQLTHLPRGAWEPTWSPDGEQIAFVARDRADQETPADTDIFVMDADGTHVRRLAGTPSYDRRPDWSPDGSQIVFDTYERHGVHGSAEIWVVSIDDDKLNRLVSGSFHGGLTADPTWSPDGRWIAVTRFALETINGMIVHADVWVMRSDGTGEYPLHPATESYDVEVDPSWSPDGNSITFTDLSSLIESRIGVVNVRTGEVAYLPTPRFASDLSWSAEGILASMGTALPSPSIWIGKSDL